MLFFLRHQNAVFFRVQFLSSCHSRQSQLAHSYEDHSQNISGALIYRIF